MSKIKLLGVFANLLLFVVSSFAQTVKVGEGSYTTQFPGTDAAARNGYPSGTPYLVGNAKDKPVPTNDWWSHKIKNQHSANLFNYPYTMATTSKGLITTYIPWGVIGDNKAVEVGIDGLNASTCNVSDYSDWTVTLDWQTGTNHMTATSGIGMPFIYFSKDSNSQAVITANSGTVTIDDEMLLIVDASSGADFAVYAPTGSKWIQSGKTYTSDLNGKNYWSMAFLEQSSSPASIAQDMQKHAYVFPTNTRTTWSFDESTSVIRTDFEVETEIKEGTDSLVLLGLLPHQWAHLANNSSEPKSFEYETVRGKLKCLEGNSFSVENTFYGILPTLPYLDNYSNGFNPRDLNEKIESIKNDALATWTDSYNEGQVMNRLIQTARIADLTGNTTARDKMLATVKERLEDWLTYESNEVAFLFYYNNNWSAMLGYPAGHGQDVNINDHHFHWGYFIHAAAFLEQYEPGWAKDWGPMIDMLVRDASSPRRNDKMFPFLRNFSPYAGHCWANGFASFPQGNDQESTSESMQFNSSLIHWGMITGNDSIRDLGIYLYTTEQTAIEEYWLDINERNFGPTQQYSLVSRVWGNSYDNGTFWTSDIAASYGIEMYPIHGGSFYLGHDTTYVEKLWKEIEKNTGILKNEVNPNLWHDVYWCYLALIDPAEAIKLYESNPNRELKFGVADAQTYHWLHASNALGKVDISITADYPMAMAFSKKGETIYVAHNYSSKDITVTFSDKYELKVPANTLVTSKDIVSKGLLTSEFDKAYVGGSANVSLNISAGSPSKVEFYLGDSLLETKTSTPYTLTVENLKAGRNGIFCKIYENELFNVSNTVVITVGEQLPFLGIASSIPGDFYAGDYDLFEGGIGQGISYSDQDRNNNGDYRETEYVDAGNSFSEGKIVGWINSGEWLEYTVDVDKAGYYNLNLRYASGNQNGGGPFNIYSDGTEIMNNITVSNSGDWDVWKTKTISKIPLKEGTQILKLEFDGGEMNIGKLTFAFDSNLDYSQPVANAGENILVELPLTSTNLDASKSVDPANGTLVYSWSQEYGPSTAVFSDPNVSQPSISSLIKGIYSFVVEVSNGVYTDVDQVFVICSDEANVAPKVSIYSPLSGSSFIENNDITIEASASDLIGNVTTVEFFANEESLGSATQAPYSVSWKPTFGTYILKAIATDNDNATSTSNLVEIDITQAPSCEGTAYNGDYDYKFSDDKSNPTLTFIPNQTGMGNPTCLLYYGTNPGALGGYPVTPNVPYKLNAAEGTQIYFYYTYSHPAGGERNTSANMDTYVIGTCQTATVSIETSETEIKVYPNPFNDALIVETEKANTQIKVFSISGELIQNVNSNTLKTQINTSAFAKGVYLIQIDNQAFRMVK
ncbi:MAG: carbohydrate-binding protein [Bacteroidia bacterium]